MQSFKHDRIVQALIEDINSMIVLKKIKDPRVSNRVSVLHVKVSKDYTSATVFVSSFMQDGTLNKTVDALNHAKGYIQSLIHKKHKWRHTPKLLFKASDGLSEGDRVINLLSQSELNASETDTPVAKESNDKSD